MNTNIVIYVVALFCANAYAQQCYQCATITTDDEGLDLPASEVGFESCTDGPLQTVDCSLQGGCQEANYSLNYDVTGTGRVNVSVVLRTCGAAADVCLSNNDLQTVINSQRATIDAMLPDGVDFVSATGNACVCSTNLCNDMDMNMNMNLNMMNGAPVWKISSVSLFMSLLISYIATKRD